MWAVEWTDELNRHFYRRGSEQAVMAWAAYLRSQGAVVTTYQLEPAGQ
jgi:hypothetical protein